VLTAEVDTARWFEALLAATPLPRTSPRPMCQAGVQLAVGILRRAEQAGQGSLHQPDRPKGGQLLALVGNGTISGSIAKQVLEKMLEPGDAAATIVEREGLKQTSDTGAIEAAVATILANNADKVEQYKAARKRFSASSWARR
jgi:aspartyl-tRNA(Asn)/glutamyl-tRNA(Gln) amidotransferase subunit B